MFCPVKGAEPGLAANAGSLLVQDHQDYRVVFVVDSDRDPAVQTLRVLNGSAPSEIFVAGEAVSCGQKVHNLARAVEHFRESADILVFCDADAMFPSGWLTELTAPLSKATVGAATGYRWYVPPRVGAGPFAALSPRRWASLFRSGWNASVAGFLGPHANNFVWGGSTAIRRKTFDDALVQDFWAGALSDDFALTRAVRAAGFDIVYVPTCLVPSHGACGWGELLEFTTRQMKITRVYSPRVWTLGFFSHTLFSVAFLGLTLSLAAGPAPVILWLTLYVLAAVRADARVEAAKRAIDDPSLRWFYVLRHRSFPLVASLSWKGILRHRSFQCCTNGTWWRRCCHARSNGRESATHCSDPTGRERRRPAPIRPDGPSAVLPLLSTGPGRHRGRLARGRSGLVGRPWGA